MSDEQEPSEYTVDINGVEHTMLLTEEDAKRYGDSATKAKAKAPANKSSSASSK